MIMAWKGTMHDYLVLNLCRQAAMKQSIVLGVNRQLPILAFFFQAIRAINGGDHETSAEEFTNRVFNKIDVNGDGENAMSVILLSLSAKERDPCFLS